MRIKNGKKYLFWLFCEAISIKKFYVSASSAYLYKDGSISIGDGGDDFENIGIISMVDGADGKLPIKI